MVESPGHRVGLADFLPERHGDLLGSWLRRPHVSRWRGDPDKALLEVATPPNEGGEALITVDGRPVGYLRWQVPDRAELDAAGLHEVPPDAVDIDIAVGETAWLGRGVGPQALMLLVDRLVAEGASTIMLATSTTNVRAVRAYETAGFIRRRQFVDTDGGTYWLLTIEARPG